MNDTTLPVRLLTYRILAGTVKSPPGLSKELMTASRLLVSTLSTLLANRKICSVFINFLCGPHFKARLRVRGWLNFLLNLVLRALALSVTLVRLISCGTWGVAKHWHLRRRPRACALFAGLLFYVGATVLNTTWSCVD